MTPLTRFIVELHKVKIENRSRIGPELAARYGVDPEWSAWWIANAAAEVWPVSRG